MGPSLWCSKAESAVEQPSASSFTEWPDWSDYQTRPCPAMRSQYHFLTHFAMHHYMLEDVCLETGNHCNAVRLYNTFKSVPTTVSCKFQNEQSRKPINCSRSAAFSPTSTNFMPSSCHRFWKQLVDLISSISNLRHTVILTYTTQVWTCSCHAHSPSFFSSSLWKLT